MDTGVDRPLGGVISFGRRSAGDQPPDRRAGGGGAASLRNAWRPVLTSATDVLLRSMHGLRRTSRAMELIETTRSELVGQLESKVQALLGRAFPDVVAENGDYYAVYETPVVIMILQKGEQVIGHLCA
jgi:hypothetical protein